MVIFAEQSSFGEDSEDVAEVLVGTARASLVAEEDRSGTSTKGERVCSTCINPYCNKMYLCT